MFYIFLQKVLAFFLAMFSYESLRNCTDCVLLTDCPESVKYISMAQHNQKFKDTFQHSVCGYEGDKPKVCCSDFSDNEHEKNSLDNHINVKLLPEPCGEIPMSGRRVFGAEVPKLYEFPWMALIFYKKDQNDTIYNCSGSIINSRYILTAAHCVQGKKISRVRIGEFDVRYKKDCIGKGKSFACETHLQDIEIEESIVHENYKYMSLPNNDIALLRLQKPVDFVFPNAAPICLPLSDELRNLNLSNRQATVAGWGRTEDVNRSNVLLKVSIPILPASQCTSTYKRYFAPGVPDRTENKLCAGSHRKDACNGDSGGPLMVETKYNGINKIVQYGIVSSGSIFCGSSPGIYVDVRKYIKWILDHIRS